MARKSRRSTSSRKSSSLFAWPRVLIVVFPLLAAVLIFTNNQNARSVLGISDTNFLNFNSEHKATKSGQNISSEHKCKPNRVATFSVTGLCDTRKNVFKQISYICEDGTSGTVTKECAQIQNAFERAVKACAKNTKCAKSESERKLTPKPTHTQ